jgi:signal transduction histidine kinase
MADAAALVASDAGRRPAGRPAPAGRRPAPKPQPTLSRVLIRRMAAVAALLLLGLFGLVLLIYTADRNDLRALTAEYLARGILADLRAGQPPPVEGPWQSHPGSYGWRILDRSDAAPPHVLAAMNARLFPPAPGQPVPGTSVATDVPEEAVVVTEPARAGAERRWVQVLVASDPAAVWLRAAGRDLVMHVALPMLIGVPLLTLLLWVVARRTLAPLKAVAAAARDSSAAGEHLRRLSGPGLPREIAVVLEALLRMRERLDATPGRLRRFAREAAEQVREPLAALGRHVGQLPEGEPRDRLAAELEALRARVDALLKVAEAEAGAAGAPARFDMAAAARAVCTELMPLAVERGRHLAFKAAGPAPLFGNAALAASAVRDLAEYALLAVPADGHVEVTVDTRGTVAVSDDGTAADRAEALERFPGGPGGGLALVRRIAALQGGSVRLLEGRVELRLGGG